MADGDDLTLPGALTALGGVSLLLYVVTKEWFAQRVGHAPHIVDHDSALVWHLLENVPIALIGAGLLVWYRGQRSTLDRWDRTGLLLTVFGLVSTLVSHVVEHALTLLANGTSTTAFWIVLWWYYASWVVTGTGLTLVGASRTESRLLSRTQRSLVVWILPLSVFVAFLLGSTLFASVSDGFKIPILLVMIAIGINLREAIEGGDATGD